MATSTDVQTRLVPASQFRISELTKKFRLGESIIQILIFTCGAISIGITSAIVFVLGQEALLFFSNPAVSLVEFFTTTQWQPAIERFGIWPLVTSTLVTSFIAILTATPLGLCAAIFLSEYASERIKGLLNATLEVLAGVPTVVYGYFALTFVTPILRNIFGQGTVENS